MIPVYPESFITSSVTIVSYCCNGKYMIIKKLDNILIHATKTNILLMTAN